MTTRSKNVGKAAPTQRQDPWRSRGLNLWAPFTTIRLALQRVGKTWPLLAVVTLGMTIAVALLATIPFYNDLVNDLVAAGKL